MNLNLHTRCNIPQNESSSVPFGVDFHAEF